MSGGRNRPYVSPSSGTYRGEAPFYPHLGGGVRQPVPRSLVGDGRAGGSRPSPQPWTSAHSGHGAPEVSRAASICSRSWNAQPGPRGRAHATPFLNPAPSPSHPLLREGRGKEQSLQGLVLTHLPLGRKSWQLIPDCEGMRTEESSRSSHPESWMSTLTLFDLPLPGLSLSAFRERVSPAPSSLPFYSPTPHSPPRSSSLQTLPSLGS